MTGRRPWLKWYPADWRAEPTLRMCSRAARSLWLDMLGLMHDGEPYGHLTVAGIIPTPKQLASLLGDTERETLRLLAELEAAGVFSRDDAGRIFCRRMLRDHQRLLADTSAGHLGGHPRIKRGTVPKELRVRPFKKSDSPVKARRIFDRSGGRCHWCRCELTWDGVWHADHVVAIRDGGTNDEENIVASCPDCNGRRALIDDPPITEGVGVGNATDTKAHMPEARSQKPEKEDTPPPSGSAPSEGKPPDNPAALRRTPGDQPPVPDPAPPKRGTRLPADWTLSPELRAWAIAEGLADPDREAAKFRDHWTAKAGKDATKLDWAATWRTWVRKAIDWQKEGRGNGQAEQAQRGHDDSLLARTKALLAERDARLGAGDPDRAADAVLPAVPGGR